MSDRETEATISPEEGFKSCMQKLEELDGENGDSPKKVISLVNNAITAASDMNTTVENTHRNISRAYSLGIFQLSRRIGREPELSPIIAAYITQRGEHNRIVLSLKNTGNS